MKKKSQQKSVFLYTPNLIGYARIVLTLASFWYINDVKTFLILYCSSCALDVADGWAARLCGESSKFGAVLDMVTDRFTTSGLLCYLSCLRGEWCFAFQFLISLDISSHYMQMYYSLSKGSLSHKGGNDSWILNLYYTNRIVLFTCCFFNELFFLVLYCLWKGNTGPLVRMAGLASFPICLLKQFLNVLQLIKASQGLAKLKA